MKNQQQSCNCGNEVDRMINEGLGNGTIIAKYTEPHLKLKEKEAAMAAETYSNDSENTK
ncbi:hypothetical protein [Planomicrobium sp. MB-3u-38]|uniref:hypothetical protein n=1 Tax=Planomicrobium sp. MB-3u-38 TaxID=2058318 RepID=UPI0018EC7D58|nr:hypothetical protein [Planomicrobium sp. MB-3u-38]